MNLLINEQQKSYENAKICYICKEIYEDKHAKDKKYCKVRDYYPGEYRSATHSICNLKYRAPKETPIAFHSGSYYDYHFIMKEFEGKFGGGGGAIYLFKRKYKKKKRIIFSSNRRRSYKKRSYKSHIL